VLGRVWLAAAGVAAGAVAGPHASPLAGALVCIAAAAGLSARRRSALTIAGLLVFGFGCGVLASAVRTAVPGPLRALARSVPSCALEGRVLEEAGGLGTLVAADRLECTGFPSVRNGGVVVAGAAGADPGAKFTATGLLVPLGDDPFDQQRRRLGAAAAFYSADHDIGITRGALFEIAATIRRGIETAARKLDARSSAMLRGLVVGDTAGMDRRTEEHLRDAGLSHLVAVSGSNVAIVLGAILLFARRLPLRLRLLLAAGGLALFVVVVGPDPSVLRAAAMGAVGLTALALGRSSEPLQGLGIALLAVLLLRPALVFSAGLHLSAAATAGIVVFGSRIDHALSRLPGPVSATLAASFAAQAGVAPVLIATFGELPVAGIAANLLAAPAVPIATIAGLAAGLVAIVAVPVGEVLAEVGGQAAGWILAVGDHLGAPAWASVAVPRVWAWPLGIALAGAALTALHTPRRNQGPQVS
jgi:competence protein ComEC